eukprot:TRINITY_DN10147_c0_g1_i1.p1 TRINITY_DN10147_c0_g1~~TRINITY_DN10147_c0_g1_i1.p1  ORF type:complete len:426 (-),score=69.70 TRINITY_DN10147_c0_g1_i1:161-1417(-)
MDDATAAIEAKCIVSEKWVVEEKVASGGFGCIFKAHKLNDKKEVVAVKTEKKANKDYLKIESEIYNLVSGSRGFPECIFQGQTTFRFPESEERLNCNVLVMSLLGPSLSDLFYQMEKKFSLKTVLMLGIQMIDRLQVLHSVGIVHRDIKPGNFVMGRPGSSTQHEVYLIDFGLAHQFRDSDNNHMPYQDNVPFRGTHRYASVTSHFRVEQTRRDDMEALGYVLIYFLRGGLPWQSLQFQRNERRLVIGNMKKKTSTAALTENLPESFGSYLDYTKGLAYDESPDYDYMRDLFTTCAEQNEIDLDYKYDWSEGVPKRKETESKCIKRELKVIAPHTSTPTDSNTKQTTSSKKRAPEVIVLSDTDEDPTPEQKRKDTKKRKLEEKGVTPRGERTIEGEDSIGSRVGSLRSTRGAGKKQRQ